jgi:hypothetical protein
MDHGAIAKKHSTIDTVKKVAGQMGWDGSKTSANREMLSQLKDFYTEHFDGPLKEIKYMMLGTPVQMLFVAMREPYEIARTVSWCCTVGIRCQTVLVRGIKEEIDHDSHSDAKVLQYDYDLTFKNYSTENDFIEKINDYMNKVLKNA